MMNRRDSKNGFTLVEMLAVMAVIGVLAAMVLGISGWASRKADESKAEADIETIKNLLEEYRSQQGFYPEESQWDEVIEDMDETFYIETDELKDPWGRVYIYKKNGKYVISVFSSGPDGQYSSDLSDNDNKDNVGQQNF